MAVKKKPECFVIAPIGSEKSDIRTRSDQILNHIIRPVADDCGFKAVRADELPEPGSITAQIIGRILKAPMVVADLTGSNANVFYELAVRHAVGKPCIQLIQKGERLPFDVADVRAIEIDHTNLDSVASAKDALRRHMQFLAANPDKSDSPIAFAVNLAAFTTSDDPIRRQLAEILTGMAELRKGMQSIESFTAVQKSLESTEGATQVQTPVESDSWKYLNLSKFAGVAGVVGLVAASAFLQNLNDTPTTSEERALEAKREDDSEAG